jgi:hypothetical protein
MKRNEFIEFCRLDENIWNKFMDEESEEGSPAQPSWKHREKMARADLIIKQQREAGETNRKKIVSAVVAATGVSRKTASGWISHWDQHHTPPASE